MPAELIFGFILIVLCCLYGYTSRQRWLDVARIRGWNLAVEIWKNTGELPDITKIPKYRKDEESDSPFQIKFETGFKAAVEEIKRKNYDKNS